MAERQNKQSNNGDFDDEQIDLTPDVIEALELLYKELKKVRDPDRRQELEGLGVFIK